MVDKSLTVYLQEKKSRRTENFCAVYCGWGKWTGTIRRRNQDVS